MSEPITVDDDTARPENGVFRWHAEQDGKVTTRFEDVFENGRIVTRRMVFPAYGVDTKAVEDVRNFMDANPLGCCLHIALSDENLKDDNIAFCVTWAKEAIQKEPDGNHEACLALAERLAAMTELERWNVHDEACGICCRPVHGPEVEAWDE